MKTSPAIPVIPPDESRSLFDRAHLAGQDGDLLQRIERGLQRRKRRRKVAVKTAGATLLLLAAAFWAVPYIRQTGDAATPPAHRQQLTLADGSAAELNAQTKLHTDFRYGRRIVQLTQGEAFFSVVRDPSHPFLVQTPAGVVRVTGTQFDVRLVPGGTVAVTLFEGSVVAAPAGGASSSVGLKPGQQVTLGVQPAEVHTLSATALENTVAWRHGRIVLDGLTLAEAVARLAEFHGRAIAVAPELAGLRLGGSFPLDDLAEFFDALKTMAPLQVVPQGDGSYRIVAR